MQPLTHFTPSRFIFIPLCFSILSMTVFICSSFWLPWAPFQHRRRSLPDFHLYITLIVHEFDKQVQEARPRFGSHQAEHRVLPRLRAQEDERSSVGPDTPPQGRHLLQVDLRALASRCGHRLPFSNRPQGPCRSTPCFPAVRGWSPAPVARRS